MSAPATTPAAQVAPPARKGLPRWALFLIPVAVGLIIWAIGAPDAFVSFVTDAVDKTTGEPKYDPEAAAHAWALLAIFVATILAIILKPLPMGALCMIGMAVIAAGGTLSIGDTLSGFANTTIWLIVMAFFISRGVVKTGLGRRIALFFVAKLGRRPLGVAYGMALTDLVLAPATPSNTARAGGIIMPILTSISRQYGSEPNGPSARKVGAYFMQTAYIVNCVTSAMFLTAMAGNPLAQELAAGQDITITWGNWALAAIVPGLVSLIAVPWVLLKVFPPEVKETPEAAAEAQRQLTELGPLHRNEWIMTGTIVVLLLLWTLGGPLMDMSATTAALIGLSVLLLVNVLTWEDVKKETQAWDTLVWFAALVMMATFLNTLGLIPWVSSEMSALTGGLPWMVAFAILTMVYWYSHYLFASNTAHISAMYAAFLATAVATGAPPLFAALVFAFISNLFATLTHYAAGPAPVLFGTGYVPLNRWWTNGLVMSVVLIVIWTSVGTGWMALIGIL
ncbi:MAG TPA: anion permease [Micrococcales bacterium]|uniref:DASS family sodium-coupled anion symporter n=1 Tax=Miniimonas arenae TaxID=676201 RepID=A0A5C5BCQ3_9MICO|nr:DASS family sodium-coupled anion symporter [Miniimonas arenae]TNU74992.1 DASS family sodium-coupled anion symporter [Miniimonas arenae]HCX83947.1 anion permease [Micrococcales bacterium]